MPSSRFSTQFALFYTITLACLACPARADDVPQATQDLIEAAIGETLIHPEAARWEFDTIHDYVAGGVIVCGYVTSENSLKKYLASRRFYAVIRNEKVTELTIEDKVDDQPARAAIAKLKLLCDILK